jgi:hypothetical protein
MRRRRQPASAGEGPKPASHSDQPPEPSHFLRDANPPKPDIDLRKLACMVAEEVVTVLEQRGIVSIAGVPSRRNGKEKTPWREQSPSLGRMDRIAIEGGFESTSSIARAEEVLRVLKTKKRQSGS